MGRACGILTTPDPSNNDDRRETGMRNQFGEKPSPDRERNNGERTRPAAGLLREASRRRDYEPGAGDGGIPSAGEAGAPLPGGTVPESVGTSNGTGPDGVSDTGMTA